MTKVKGKKLTQLEQWKQSSVDYFNHLSEETKKVRSAKLVELMSSPLYTAPPCSWEDSKKFGWMRGIAMSVETFFEAKWHSWLTINAKGSLDDDDYVPYYNLSTSPNGSQHVTKMIDKCIEAIHAEGSNAREFIEWLGYSLGIAWFEKPNFKDKTWKFLYENFVLDLIYMYPSDYFSHFMSIHGQSGVNDYYPTPLHVTQMIAEMVSSGKHNDFYYEPCLGAGAMLLPVKSLNLLGTELSQAMVKVASLQAFLFQPSLLYTPKPICGLHVDEKTLTINKYYEFDTNTRIYCGDSLLGEYTAPKNIFEQDSETLDIYYLPTDLRKNEWYQLEELFLTTPWADLSKEEQVSIVKAQSRNFGIDVSVTNPPFNAKMGSAWKEKFKIIESSNQEFIREREEMLLRVRVAPPLISEHLIMDAEIKLQTVKANKKKKVLEDQFAFDLF